MALTILLIALPALAAPTFPKLTGRVVDDAGILSPAVEASLTEKLARITENSPWYSDANASPWGRAIIPLEMVSVLAEYSSHAAKFPVKGPAVGLFADQEIRLIKGPLFANEPYELDTEVVFLSGSRRTESMWLRTQVYAPGGQDILASMLLNVASLKDSYANYAGEEKTLYGAGAGK